MMTTVRQKFAILAYVTLGFMGKAPIAHAQFSTEMIDTGGVVPNLKLNDISGKKVQLYDYLSEGYTVVLELGMTTCNICWGFKKTGAFESVFEKYGPNGSVKAKKIMPIYVEIEPKTSREDLEGKGSMTQGDWLTGTSYPIVDLERADTLVRIFQRPNNFNVSTPTFLVICPDRKLIYTANGANGMTEHLMIELMEGRCTKGKIPNNTGIEEILSSSSVQLYPNPAKGSLQIDLEVFNKAKIQLSVSNLIGQTFLTQALSLTPGLQTANLNTSTLAPGIYLLSIITEQGMIQEKFTIQ